MIGASAQRSGILGLDITLPALFINAMHMRLAAVMVCGIVGQWAVKVI